MDKPITETTSSPKPLESFEERLSAGMERAQLKAPQAASKVRGRAVEAMDRRKQQLCENLDELADALEHVDGGTGSSIARSAGQYVRDASERLRRDSSEQMLRQVGRQLEERPVLVMAGMFAAGFAVARLLRG